jgi:hypothetical protein
MNKKLTIGLGISLILLGMVAFASELLRLFLGFRVWHLWPVLVILVGLGLVTPATLGGKGSKLGWLYVLGLPVLTTGAILFIASVFRWWHVWAILWPLEVLGTALGFALAGLKTRLRELFVPALLIGANGLCLQFCAVTGWWRAWSVLWAIEPIVVGIAILILSNRRHSRLWLNVGLGFWAIGVIGFLESASLMTLVSIRPLRWLWHWMTPLALVLTGAGLLLWKPLHRTMTSTKTDGVKPDGPPDRLAQTT